MSDKLSVNPEFIETVRMTDLVFYSHDLLLEGLIQKYGGRRIDDLSASIDFVYESKYTGEDFFDPNFGVQPIVVKCDPIVLKTFKNQSQNYEFIERLIEKKISHEIREHWILVYAPTYNVVCEMAQPNPNNIISSSPWHITGVDFYNEKPFLTAFNFINRTDIDIRLNDFSMADLLAEFEKK